MNIKNFNVEVEHREIILQNEAGDHVIIPANKRGWVKRKLKEGCHTCIDSLVETLPVMEDYAQDGSLVPKDNKNIKGTIVPVKNDIPTVQLPEVEITAKAPTWEKYKKELESKYPAFKENEYLKKFKPEKTPGS